MTEIAIGIEAGPPEDQTSWQVTDTETTGMAVEDQVIEWAIIGPEPSWVQMFKPTVPIHCEARASHHITDDELKDKPFFLDWLAENEDFRPFGDAQYLVAHNISFDLTLLKQTGMPDTWLPPKTICTYRCSRHLWPNAPSFKNQALRYHFDLDQHFTPEEKAVLQSLAAHRAPYDTIVTRGLLRLMLESCTLYQLEQLTRSPFLLQQITFGTHRGKTFREAPKSWLQWILDQGPERIENKNGVEMKVGFNEDTRHTARTYLAV